MLTTARDFLGHKSPDCSSPSALDQLEKLSEFKFIYEEFLDWHCSTPLPLAVLF